MSEVLRELVVRLSMDSGNVSQDLKGLATAVRQADANFKAAGAGIKNFEGSTAQARAKVTQLNSTLQAQQQMVSKQAQALDNSRTKLGEVTSNQQKLAQKVDAARAALEKEVAVSGKSSDASKELAKELKKLEGQYAAGEKQAIRLASGIQRGEVALTNAETAVKGTEAALKKANAELQKSETLWGRFGHATRQAQERLATGGKQLSTAGQALTRSVTMPIVAAGGAVLAASVQWESAFTGVRKTVNGTEEQMTKLHDGILKMSQEIPSSADAIAKVAENAGQLGIQTDNVLKFSKVMIDLGNTTNLSADEGAVALAQFANITQMSQTNFDRLGSTIVDLGNNFATTEKDIVTMGMRVAAAGKQVGMTEANIMALATAASSVGIEAEAGGTALSTVLLNIDIAAAKGGKAMAGYAKVAGMSAKDFATAWKSDPSQAMLRFVQGLNRVKEEGGNVALTLEQMGYKEKRTRDALMRLSGAGDTLSSALGRADAAWQSNVALTNEANLRYGTAASRLQVLRNRAVATGISFGNAMTPYLEKAMDALSGLLDGFQRLSPAQQDNIVKWGMMAVAVGPVVNATGKLMTSASVLLKAFSGPAGWIALAAGAAVGLGVALSSLPSAADEARRALSDIRFDVSMESKEKIAQGINMGIAAANKVHDISVTVDAGTTALGEQLDDIFSDGKMSRKEYTAASTYVKTVVQPDLEAARKILESKVNQYKKTLEGAVDAQGQPLSEGAKATLVSEFAEKNGQQIQELETALTEYQELLTAIKNQGGKATEEQVANLEKALEKVGALRKAIQEAQDEGVQAAQAAYNLTVQGGGNEDSMGKALGFVAQTRANELARAEATLNSSLAKAGNNAEAASAAYAAFDASVAKANQAAQKGYERIAEGVAMSDPSITEKLKKIQGLQAALSEVLALPLDERSGTESELRSVYKKAFEKIPNLDELVPEGAKLTMDSIFAKSDEDVTMSDINFLEEQSRKLLGSLSTSLVDTVSSDDTLNPMKALMSGLLDSNAFAAIDPTTVQGPLLDMLKLVDLSTESNALGEQVPEGVALGVNSGAATSLSPSALSPLREALTSAVASLFQIRSPARIMMEPGRQIPAGIAVGILSNKGAVVGAIREVYGAAIREAQIQEAALRRAMATLLGGGPGGTPGSTVNNNDNSSNATVNVSQMVVRADSDAAVIASQIAALNRRTLAGYGARA